MKHSSKSRKKLLKRPLGLYRGEIWIAPDFDAPMMLVDDHEAKALAPDKSVAKKEIRKLSRPAKAGLGMMLLVTRHLPSLAMLASDRAGLLPFAPGGAGNLISLIFLSKSQR